MHTTPPSPLPRKKWHLRRWLALLALATSAYYGWKAYDFRAAIAEAKALGWQVEYTDPLDTIQKDWRTTFIKETWRDGVPGIGIGSTEILVQQRALLLRLDPSWLEIYNSPSSRDLTALDGLTRLKSLVICQAPHLTNLDALKNLPTLEVVSLEQCPTLTNVDALSHLTGLRMVGLNGCNSLTNVDALRKLTTLTWVNLNNCPALTNVDALKHLTALESVFLIGCTGLTNVDALKTLPSLRIIDLSACTGLPEGTIKALKAALPNTEILDR